jgi:hypothetical protein
LTEKTKNKIQAMFANSTSTTTGENTMPITAANIKEIRQEFAKLKPASVTLEGSRVMTVKEAVFALAPTLERMKKRGFDTQELAERLHEKGIDVKPPTLAKYLNEFRRGKGKKGDTPPPPAQAGKTSLASQPSRPATASTGEFIITPDIPMEN